MGGLVNNKEFMLKHSVTPKISKMARLWEDRVYNSNMETESPPEENNNITIETNEDRKCR